VAVTYWPFLIAANPFLDYRVVLCPDFIERSERAHVLRNSIEETYSDEGFDNRLQFAEVKDVRLGLLSIFYKKTRLQGKTDSSGRSFVNIEGILIKGSVDRKKLKSVEAERLLESVHPQIQNAFESFWSAGASASTCVASYLTVDLDETQYPDRSASSPAKRPTVLERQIASPPTPPKDRGSRWKASTSTRALMILLTVLGIALMLVVIGYIDLARKYDKLKRNYDFVTTYGPY
jgi:hypothetical protein